MKALLKKILYHLPVKNQIIFESVPDLSDNTMAVFEEMLRRGLNEKYQMIWWVSDQTKKFPSYKNVRYMDQKTRLRQLLFLWHTMRSKCLIYCNQMISKRNVRQTGFYLTHGTGLKLVHNYNLENTDFDYTLIASEGTKDFMVDLLKGDKEKYVGLGFPRNDVLTASPRDLHQCLSGDFQKVIVWYPTFRQHKNGNVTGASNALPVLHDTEMAIKLNEVAREAGVLLVVKPHFAQDVSYIKSFDLSNIRFIDDSFFIEHSISSYEFVGSCDAMLTDYSSIYFDYLLCDKPVGAIWEDVDEYRKNPGLIENVDYYMSGAEKIYTLAEFEQFIRDVASDSDRLKKERSEINKVANFATDGQNAKRVTDFIIEKAKL